MIKYSHNCLPYPGGPHIDRLAHEGEPLIELPRAWLEEGSYDFSFSGLKSAVINTVHNAEAKKVEEILPQTLAASFQASVIDILVTKTVKAAEFCLFMVFISRRSCC